MLINLINPVTFKCFAALLNCTPVDRASVINLVGWGLSFLSIAVSIGAQLMTFLCFRFSVVLMNTTGIYKLENFFMLNSAEIEICPGHKC